MKRLLLSLFFLSIVVSINAQGYTSMISNNNAWCIEWYAGLGYSGFKFQHSNDTIINGQTFQVFKSDITGKNTFFEDKENKKVYKYNYSNAKVELLYDFNLSLGDTITLNFKNFKSILMKVSLVDSVMTNVDTLTIIHFNHTDTTTIMGGRLNNDFKWIEGVGSNWHPNYTDYFTTTSKSGGTGYNVICTYINGRRFFVNDTTYCNLYSESSNCQGLNSTKKIFANTISVYPSPFTNYFTVDAENIEVITLYDMLGRTMYHSKVKTTNPILVFFEKELDAGYYQLKVKTKTGIFTQKLMKQ